MADGFVELNSKKIQTEEGVSELNRMLQVLFDNIAGDADTVRVYKGYGVPSFSAGSGSIYMRLDGGANTSIYIMEGSSWTAK